jgi:maltooligosyltrehalose trehalohydrolase
VHGPSEVVEIPPEQPAHQWNPPKLRDYVLYEIHVGTFTPEGTFDAVIPSLPRLRKLGVTAVELMPVAEFPGIRNWGYDGVCPFAAHSGYGGLAAFNRLVRACHDHGMAVVLDVVYNHFGPEGNYLREFGPYFTDRYATPWGAAINFDGPWSDPVRRYFIENALYWIRDCGVDALRLDAIHAIFDRSAFPFLEELAGAVHRYSSRSGRRVYLIAESDLNDSRVLRPQHQGGLALDAQWADDLHHSLHTLLTGEKSGYYADFGSMEHLAQALRSGWTYSGQYSPARKRRFGNSPAGLPPEKFVVCSQNHDQTGNRMRGERLSHLVSWDRAKLAAATVLLSPFTPLLFMGEEYAEPAPFLYHVSHTDLDLQSAVRSGRKAEFFEFLHQGEPPDPQDEVTFQRSKLRQHLAREGRHAVMHAFYTELIALRKAHPALRPQTPGSWTVRCHSEARLLDLALHEPGCDLRVLLNYGGRPFDYARLEPGPLPRECLLDSADPRWSPDPANPETREGPLLQPFSCIVLGSCSHAPNR